MFYCGLSVLEFGQVFSLQGEFASVSLSHGNLQDASLGSL